MAQRFDLRISQRTYFEKGFAFREADGTTPIPLTGATAKAQIRRRPGDTELLAEFSVVVNAADGEVIISLSPTQTANLPLGRAEYDVLVMPPDDKDFVLIEGAVKIDGTVTA